MSRHPIPEDRRARRGEPVIVAMTENTTCEGTIEWGDDEVGYSIYLECDGRSGGRVERRASEVQPDPDGDRPVWKSLWKVLGEVQVKKDLPNV